MSRLVLYRAIASPPARSVMMLGDILGLKFEYREVKLLEFEHKSNEYKKLNPMGTVPVLQDGDFILSESHAILKYLTEQYGGDHRESLYPKDTRARALVDQGLFFNSGFFFPRMAAVAIPTLLRGYREPTSQQTRDITEAFEAVERYLNQRRFLAGSNVTLADLAVGATATATNILHPIDTDKYPRFAEWLKELNEMPCFKYINAEGLSYLEKFLAKAKEMKVSKSK